MILMQANTFLRPLEGMGPGNLDFLGPKWLLVHSMPLQGPKKSQFPPLPMALEMYLHASKSLYSFILRIKLYDLKTEVNQNKVKLKIK
jgi:hypothetical protein